MDNEMNDGLVCKIRELVRQAGEKIMGFYRGGSIVTQKADASPLTAADLASHEFLIKSLQPLLSGVRVISEESDPVTRMRPTGERFWLVDPLDGTKEFLKGTNEFTVNVALIEECRPVLGVVHAPALALTYWALRDSGAWLQLRGGKPTSISTRRADSRRLSVVASKDHAGPLVEAMLARMPGAKRHSMGSSLKFCLVAEGEADIYLRDVPTMEWDTAAAHCIVDAAGGSIYLLDGTCLQYGKPGLKNPSLVVVGDAGLDWAFLVGRTEHRNSCGPQADHD